MKMFPSSGYFRGLDCPFYASGLCERPYCHYRHSKQSSDKDSSWISKSSVNSQRVSNSIEEVKPTETDKPKRVSAVVNDGEKVVGATKSLYPSGTSLGSKEVVKSYAYKPQCSSSSSYDNKTSDYHTESKYKSYAKYNCNGTPSYQPTCDKWTKKSPYEEYTVSKKKEKVIEYNCDVISSSAVPEYNPTPISKLKRMQKYSSQSTTRSDLEYDPVSNFDAGFGNKAFFNLLDTTYNSIKNTCPPASSELVYNPISPTPSSELVYEPIGPTPSSELEYEPTGPSPTNEVVYKPTKLPSDDDEEHELVIDAKFSDESEDEGVADTSQLSDDPGSDNESKSKVLSASPLSFSSSSSSTLSSSSSFKNHSNSQSRAVVDSSHLSQSFSKAASHISSKSSKAVTNSGSSSSNIKTDLNSSSSKGNKHSKTVTGHSENQIRGDKREKTSSSEKNKLEKKKLLDEKSLKEKRKLLENNKHSDKKVSGSSSSSSSKEPNSSKKEKKDLSTKDKSSAEKLQKIKDHRSTVSAKDGHSGERIGKEKERRKCEGDKCSSSVKERLKVVERKLEEGKKANSGLAASSSGKKVGDSERRKSDPQVKPDPTRHKSELDRRKEFVSRKSESERKAESECKRLEMVRRKSESEVKRGEQERRKEFSAHKNGFDIKKKDFEKKISKDNDSSDRGVRPENSAKVKHKKDLEGDRSCDKDIKSSDKLKRQESCKLFEITKKSSGHTYLSAVKPDSVQNHCADKSKKRDPSSERSSELYKMIKKHCGEKYRSSSSDENLAYKKKSRSELTYKALKRKNHEDPHPKSLHGSSSSTSMGRQPFKKARKSKSVSIDDLFGKDSDGEEGSSSAFGQSAGDESTGLSDDNELNVIFGDTDLSENDPYDECLKIFNESNFEQQRAKPDEKMKKKKEFVELPPLDEGKKRVAHAGAASRQTNDKLRKVARPVVLRPSPAQVMQNRLMEMKKRSVDPMLRKDKPLMATSISSKVELMKRKMNLPTAGIVESCSVNSIRTVAGTAAKTQSRVAHVPKKEVLKRPTITPDTGSKVTVAIRQRYLNLIIDEYMKLIDTELDAMKKGVEEEKEVYRSCNTKVGYLNKAIHLIKRLRSGCLDTIKLLPSDNQSVSSTLPEPKKLEHLVTGLALYERLKNYILTEEELRENHFPRPEGVGRAKYYLSDITKDPYLPSDERFCVRCTKTYRVTNSGRPAVEDECMYHWAKPVRRRYGNTIDTRYRCCQGEAGSTGCEVGQAHVHQKNKYDGSSGYMTTPEREAPSEGPGVYAMDCEMLYTTAGMEVARVTVVDSECNAVYETLVKPDHEILDYNTRFSGITAADMKGVVTKLIHVQAVLLHYFSAQTILVGHSLESDLMSVKLIHSYVVDTSVLFPHRAGRPLKRALKNLTHDHLNITIQEGVDGHDSQEDAIAAMRLVHFKLQQDGTKVRS